MTDQIDQAVLRVARILGIDPFLDRRPAALSGGQRQRVALGRALVRQPAVFLMDEPLSHLDARLRNEMRTEIKAMRESFGTTIVYVTHDYSEALALGDRIAILHQGRIEQVGTPSQVFRRPVNRLVAESLGDPPMNFLAGTIALDQNRIVFTTGELAHSLDLITLDCGRVLERKSASDSDRNTSASNAPGPTLPSACLRSFLCKNCWGTMLWLRLLVGDRLFTALCKADQAYALTNLST